MDNGERLLSDVVLCAACGSFMYLKGRSPEIWELGTILEPVNLEPVPIIFALSLLSWNQFLIPILIIPPLILGGLSASRNKYLFSLLFDSQEKWFNSCTNTLLV